MEKTFYGTKLEPAYHLAENPLPRTLASFRDFNGVHRGGLTTSTEFENQSGKNLTILTPLGMTVTLPANTQSTRNTLVITHTFLIGPEAKFDWSTIITNARPEDKVVLIELSEKFKSQEPCTTSREVKLYNIVELTGVEGYKNGILIGESGYQVVATEHAALAQPFVKGVIVPQQILCSTLNERCHSSITTVYEYVVNYAERATPVYIAGHKGTFNQLKPCVDPLRDEGMYITTFDDQSVSLGLTATGELLQAHRNRVHYVPLKDFVEYGFLKSPSDILEAFGGKAHDKKRTDKLLKDFEEFLRSKTEIPNDRRRPFADQVFDADLHGFNLKDVGELAVKFGKLLKDVKSVFNETRSF